MPDVSCPALPPSGCAGCRGPFSGGKVIQAHMCGRLPHDTLVVGLEPDVPPALVSNDVEFWFRWAS